MRFHIGLAEATGLHPADRRDDRRAVEGSGRGAGSPTISRTPPRSSATSNDQHARLLAAVRGRHDAPGATQLMAEHLGGTEHVLAGLLPG